MGLDPVRAEPKSELTRLKANLPALLPALHGTSVKLPSPGPCVRFMAIQAVLALGLTRYATNTKKKPRALLS